MKILACLFFKHLYFLSLLLASASVFSQSLQTLPVAKFQPHENSPFERAYTLAPIPKSDSEITIQWPDNWPSRKPSSDLELRIFHINDLHNKHVLKAQDGSSRYVTGLIAAHVSQARNQAKQEKEHVLFLSAGDDHTGAVYDELLGNEPESFKKSLAYHAYSYAGLDAAVLGNHEFDRGTQILQKAIKTDADFPLLSANLVSSSNLDSEDYASAILATIDEWRIAIIGLTSSEDTKTNLADDPQLEVAPQFEKMSQLLPALENNIDFIIALTHIGYQQSGKVGDQDIAQLLAGSSLPSVVIGGHSHDVLHKNGFNSRHIFNGTPVLQAGQWGDYIGDLKINLRPDSKQVTAVNKTVLHSLRQDNESLINLAKEFQKIVIAPVISDFDGLLNEPLGRIADDVKLEKGAVLVGRYTNELAVANFITDAVMQTVNKDSKVSDLMAINASSIVDGLPTGEISTFADWYNVIPYADVLHLIELTPEQLKELIESNAQRLVQPDEQKQLNLTGFINQGFLHFSSALRYDVELGQGKRPQATNIRLNDQPLDTYKQNTIKLLVGDYIASGNLGWRGQTIHFPNGTEIIGFNLKSLPVKQTSYKLRESVLRYLRESYNEIIDIRKDGRLTIRYK